MQIEPTESEPLYEMDRFCDALIAIRQEIRDVESGAVDKKNNVLKNAPHTADMVISDSWDKPYSREQAAYPLPYLKANKVILASHCCCCDVFLNTSRPSHTFPTLAVLAFRGPPGQRLWRP